MTAKWENRGRGRWVYSGHGWGVFSVTKGGKKWHAFYEPFGASPVLLAEFDSRPDAQKFVENHVAKLAATKKNPAKRGKSVGALERELARLEARLVKTPTTTDASSIIRRMGDLAVSIADKKRAGKPRAHKRKATPAQLRARAKFVAMVNKRKKGRAARVARNPTKKALTGFQVAALRKGKILFLSGIGLSDNRTAASNFASVGAARHVAKQVRHAGQSLGISKVAVVTKHDAPTEIRRFLLGEA